MNFQHLLLVGVGGFFGSIARYLTSRFADQRLASLLPYGTLVVNVTGSFILGLVIGWLVGKADAGNLRVLLATGFCGGFTTFSTFALENYSLFTRKEPGHAVLYIVLSLVLSIGAVFSGIWLARGNSMVS